ncbi:MAG TPA: hypothetical protein VK961_19165 [Chthoniobacter sp.]|nr:hypothetical protein [Chthoniobacter sp.]
MKLNDKQFVRLTATLLSLPLLYVLASGPLYRLTAGSAFKPKGPWAAVDACYRPLFRLIVDTPVEGAIAPYLRLWQLRTLKLLLATKPSSPSAVPPIPPNTPITVWPPNSRRH